MTMIEKIDLIIKMLNEVKTELTNNVIENSVTDDDVNEQKILDVINEFDIEDLEDTVVYGGKNK